MDSSLNNQDQTLSDQPADAVPAEQVSSPPDPAPPTVIAPAEPTGTPAVSEHSIAEPAATQTSANGGSAAVPPKRKYTLDVVVAVLLLVLIGAALFVVNRYSKPAGSTASTTSKQDIANLRVVIEGPLANTVYPNTQSDDTETLINQQVFEGLTGVEQQTRIVPRLAVSWTNPDNNTWIFKLRPDVKFHDGNTLTATQVKASLDQSQNYSAGQQLATTIKSVEAVDANTVKITTVSPDPILINKLAQLYIWDTAANKTGDPSTGTGPYTISTNTKNLVKLTAVDGYWGGHVYTRSVEITQAVDETSAKASIANKTADAVDSYTQFTPAEAGTYKAEPVYANGTYHVAFNTLRKGSPLGKLAVRQALAQATDKQTLLQVKGIGTTVANQMVSPGIPGYNPGIAALGYNPTAAKAALVAAGYTKGFTLTFTYFPSNQKLAQELQKEYAAVGVTLKLDPESDQATLIHKAIGGGTDMYFNSVNTTLLDATDVLNDAGYFDSANYSNAQVDALKKQADQTIDAAARVKLLQQITKLATDDQADLPLFTTPNTTLYVAPGIHILQDTQTSIQIGSYFWKVYSE